VSVFDEATLVRQAATFRMEGWVLVEDIVPTVDIDAAMSELFEVFAPPEVFHHGADDARVAEFWARMDRDLTFAESPADVPAFRPNQLLGIREVPLPAPKVNALALHPNLLAFARGAMQTPEIRLYLAQAWAKYTGVTDYEQPLHRDHNHSLVPPGSAPSWLALEGLLYLNDVVEEADAPTRLVAARHTVGVGRDPLLPTERPDVYDHEVSATGLRGSFLAYRPDVWHRATNLTRPRGARFVLALGFKPAGVDWIGHGNLVRNAPNFWFQQLVATSTVDQLTALGIPRPGHPYWTTEAVAELAVMYPGLDTQPWSQALGGGMTKQH
jgi:hypothetical protein